MRNYRRQRVVKAMSARAVEGEAKGLYNLMKKLANAWYQKEELNKRDEAAATALYKRMGRFMNMLQNVRTSNTVGGVSSLMKICARSRRHLGRAAKQNWLDGDALRGWDHLKNATIEFESVLRALKREARDA